MLSHRPSDGEVLAFGMRFESRLLLLWKRYLELHSDLYQEALAFALDQTGESVLRFHESLFLEIEYFQNIQLIGIVIVHKSPAYICKVASGILVNSNLPDRQRAAHENKV